MCACVYSVRIESNNTNGTKAAQVRNKIFTKETKMVNVNDVTIFKTIVSAQRSTERKEQTLYQQILTY